MDIFDEEVRGLLSAFGEAELRYMLVGGFAVNMHGHRRATGDIDVWFKETSENRRALRKALHIAGYGDLDVIERLEFIPGWTTFRLNSGLELDLMTSLSGFAHDAFDECYARSVVDVVHDVEVRYLHRDDLLRAKRIAGRNKDLGDIDFLTGNDTQTRK